MSKVEIDVDDLPIAGACAPNHSHQWDTRGLSNGKHVVEVRATNGRGEVSRRRFEIYTGDHYLTQIGTRWADGRTELTLRDIADKDEKQQVRLEAAAPTPRAARPRGRALRDAADGAQGACASTGTEGHERQGGGNGGSSRD